MNLICKIFGHKFVTLLYHGKWDTNTYKICYFKEAFCKRCGMKLEN